MLKRFESSFQGYDQSELFFQFWVPDEARGTMVLTHGLAEHSDCYAPFAKRFAEDGWEVFAWDMRGHGRSSGKRGFAKNINEFEKDLFAFLKKVDEEKSCKTGPLVLFGHSLGGLVTLRTILAYGSLEIAALALSAPALGLAMAVPKIKDALARIANNWLPTLTLYNEIKYEDLSRDEEMLKSYGTDPLRHDKVSPGIYLGMIDSFGLVRENAKKITLPTCILAAGNDHMISTQAIGDFYDHLGASKKELHIYPDSLHEVLNDLDKELAYSDLKKFINPFLGRK